MWVFLLVFFVIFVLFRLAKKYEPEASTDCETADPISKSPKQNEGPVYRFMGISKLCERPNDSIETLHELLQESAKRFQDRILFGHREILKTVSQDKHKSKIVGGKTRKEKKNWKNWKLTEFKWESYSTVAKRALTLGSGLIEIGMKPKSRSGIFSPTRAEWMLFAYGCFSQDISIVTAYESLGSEGVVSSFSETEIESLFTTAELLPRIVNILPRLPKLKNIIFVDEAEENVLKEIKSIQPVKFVMTLSQLEEIGAQKNFKSNPPHPTSVACIMYTSGSTGDPKGVVIRHQNVVAAVAGLDRFLTRYLREDDSYLAFLPLAHVLEFVVEQFLVYKGIPIGFGSIRTLTENNLLECQGDLKELKPTIMAGVPSVWETIRKSINSHVEKSYVSRMLFNWGLRSKQVLIKYINPKSIPIYLLDKLVFSKVRNNLGGRLRYIVNGSAPISKDTQAFFNAAVCKMINGYGLTETCGVSCIMPPNYTGVGKVGVPNPACEIKLVSVLDKNYSVKNKPYPQGEILIRGPMVVSEYFNSPDLTKESFLRDGWFCSGDIGQWHSDGILEIIDRKKNLVKLSHGEYVALERLESIYKSSPFVSNICICVDQTQSKLLAFIELDEKQVQSATGSDKTLNKFSGDEDIERLIINNFNDIGKKANLASFEMISDIRLVSEKWTVKNGMLSATMKVNRNNIVKRYSEDKTKFSGNTNKLVGA